MIKYPNSGEQYKVKLIPHLFILLLLEENSINNF